MQHCQAERIKVSDRTDQVCFATFAVIFVDLFLSYDKSIIFIGEDSVCKELHAKQRKDEEDYEQKKTEDRRIFDAAFYLFEHGLELLPDPCQARDSQQSQSHDSTDRFAAIILAKNRVEYDDICHREKHN